MIIASGGGPTGPRFYLPNEGPSRLHSGDHRALLITHDEWCDEYKPKKNTFDTNASYAGMLFETYGAELAAVQAAADNHVWTLLDVDGECEISAGWSMVNRKGLFVTEKPHLKEFTTVVDEPDVFFRRIKRSGQLKKLDAHYILSDGMRNELESCRREWAKGRAKPG